MLADITPLIGRKFVATSQNIGRVERIEDGAMRCTWTHKPSESDIEEFMAFVTRVLGEVKATVCVNGNRDEDAPLTEWKAKNN